MDGHHKKSEEHSKSRVKTLSSHGHLRVCLAYNNQNIQAQKPLLQMALNTFSGRSLPNLWLKNPVFQIPTPCLNFLLAVGGFLSQKRFGRFFT
jgi:hypothetical protein